MGESKGPDNGMENQGCLRGQEPRVGHESPMDPRMHNQWINISKWIYDPI